MFQLELKASSISGDRSVFEGHSENQAAVFEKWIDENAAEYLSEDERNTLKEQIGTMVAAVDDLNAREGYRGTSFESVFLLSASEAGLNKINKMYVPEQLQAGFSDMIDEYVHFNESARNSIMERMTPDYMVVGIGSKTEAYKYKSEIISDEIEVEDYDWDKITKAVKSFVEDYNDVVKEAGESNTKDVLRNASWMTGMTDKNSNMLAKIGITIGKGNKLELDEDALKQADISSLKTVFTGYNSFVSKISQKATGISNAANRASATYTNNGTYSKTDSSLTSSKIDKEV